MFAYITRLEKLAKYAAFRATADKIMSSRIKQLKIVIELFFEINTERDNGLLA